MEILMCVHARLGTLLDTDRHSALDSATQNSDYETALEVELRVASEVG